MKICRSGSAIFTANNAFTGFTWSCSPNITLSNNTTTTVTAYGNSTDAEWIRINYGNTIVAQHNVTVSAGVIDIFLFF